MRHPSILRRRRPAVAPVELVLVFPFLLTLVAALYLIAKLGMAKVQAANDARQQTWQQRVQADQTQNGDRLKPWHSPKDSQISTQPQQPVVAGPPFKGKTFQAQSGNALIANPWAFQSIPFASLDQDLEPHTEVLALIATSVAGPSFGALSLALAPSRNPLMIAAAKTGKYVENPIIIAAAYYLKYTVGLAMEIQMDALNVMWDALEVSTFGLAGLTSKGKKIKKALNQLEDFLNCFDNLFEASKGRLGADPFNE